MDLNKEKAAVKVETDEMSSQPGEKEEEVEEVKIKVDPELIQPHNTTNNNNNNNSNATLHQPEPGGKKSRRKQQHQILEDLNYDLIQIDEPHQMVEAFKPKVQEQKPKPTAQKQQQRQQQNPNQDNRFRGKKSRARLDELALARTNKLRCTLCPSTFSSVKLKTHHMSQFHGVVNILNCCICSSVFSDSKVLFRHMKDHAVDQSNSEGKIVCAVSGCCREFDKFLEWFSHVRVCKNQQQQQKPKPVPVQVHTVTFTPPPPPIPTSNPSPPPTQSMIPCPVEGCSFTLPSYYMRKQHLLYFHGRGCRSYRMNRDNQTQANQYNNKNKNNNNNDDNDDDDIIIIKSDNNPEDNIKSPLKNNISKKQDKNIIINDNNNKKKIEDKKNNNNNIKTSTEKKKKNNNNITKNEDKKNNNNNIKKNTSTTNKKAVAVEPLEKKIDRRRILGRPDRRPYTKKFWCLVKNCHQHFDRKAKLDAHKRTHLVETRPTFKCSQCPRFFLAEWTLNVHKRKIHGQINPPVAASASSSAAQSESESEKDKKSFLCSADNCGGSFESQYKLMKHHKVEHVNQKEYFCLLCPARFQQGSQLRNHVKVSHEDAPKTAMNNSGLNVCPILECAAIFQSCEYLNNHVKFQHESRIPRPFICSVCQFGTSTRERLAKHMKFSHKKLEPKQPKPEIKEEEQEETGFEVVEYKFECDEEFENEDDEEEFQEMTD